MKPNYFSCLQPAVLFSWLGTLSCSPSSLFTDLLALLMPVGRDLPSHFRAGSQHTFEVLEELVALGILHAITYLCFGFGFFLSLTEFTTIIFIMSLIKVS